MNEVNVLAPEYMVTEEEAITNSILYQNSKLSFMNPNLIGEEAYFGDNNPVKLGMIAHMKTIRETYEKITDTSLTATERKRNSKEMENVCKMVSVDIAKWFNVEKCYLGIFNGLNAFTYPLMYDRNLVQKEGKRKKVNENFRKSLEDIVETKDGFKFKDPKQKIFVIGLGCGFFEEGYTDGEVASIILHEVGHCFQQMLVGLNANIAQDQIHQHLQMIHAILDPFATILSFGINWLVAALEGVTNDSLRNADEDVIAEEIILQMDSKEVERDRLGENIEKTTKQEMKDASKQKKGNKILGAIGYIIFGTLVGIIKMSVYIIAPIWQFVNPLSWPQRFLELGNLKLLREAKKFEQFADMFATNYGMGKELASGLSKVGKEYHKINLYTLNWLNYVPVLNVAINLGHYSTAGISGLLDEHPETKDRIVAIYKTCQFEIKNNPDLTPKQKAELQAHIDEVHKVYDDYVLSLDSRNFVYGLWKRITKAALEKEKSTVEENVLLVLKEHNEAEKLKAAKNPKQKELALKTAEAAFGNTNSFKSIFSNTFTKLKNFGNVFSKKLNKFEMITKNL